MVRIAVTFLAAAISLVLYHTDIGGLSPGTAQGLLVVWLLGGVITLLVKLLKTRATGDR